MMNRFTHVTDEYYAVCGDSCYEDQNEEMCGEAIDRLAAYEDAEEQGRLIYLPCRQCEKVYYIFENHVFPGWYLAKVWESTHLICTDIDDLGVCWVSDGFWFPIQGEAEAALKAGEKGCKGKETGA